MSQDDLHLALEKAVQSASPDASTRDILSRAEEFQGFLEGLPYEKIHVVFDGPPSHESGRFVEVEDEQGRSLSCGDWKERDDGSGLWDLIFMVPRSSITGRNG